MLNRTGLALLAALVVLAVALAVQGGDEEKTVELTGGKEYPVEQLLKAVTEITGREVVVEPNISGRRIRVPTDVKANAGMLKSLLKVNGITLACKTEDTRTFYEALTDRGLRDLRYTATKLIREGDPLPKDNVLVTVPVTLKHADPVQVERTLTQRLVDRQGVGSVVSVLHTDVLIIRDFAPQVDYYLKIIRDIDRPRPAGVRMVELEHADPADMVAALTTGSGYKSARVQVFCDLRNARIVISGDKDKLDRHEDVLKAFDKEASDRAPVYAAYELRHADPDAVAATLNKLFTQGEKARGFVAAAGTSRLVVVRAEKKLQSEIKEVIAAADTAAKKEE
jgi:type II secretory pathway component GspD/PulD (secretin)